MLQSFMDWLKQPFKSDMPALQWFLFLGLLIICIGMWKLIFEHIRTD